MDRNSRSRLDRLDDEPLALSDDAMVLEELDGFVAGILVCPDLISPSEWLPFVWNRDGADSKPAFADLDHANLALGLIMEHYNSVISILMRSPKDYEPLLAIDRRNGDVFWEMWIAGFDVAVKLRPGSWRKLLTADVESAMAMRGMLDLAEVACGDRVIPPAEYDALCADAPDNIARWVVILNNWRLANYVPSPTDTKPSSANVNPKNKVRRNDLCPCGSGRKYKKCCGLN